MSHRHPKELTQHKLKPRTHKALKITPLLKFKIKRCQRSQLQLPSTSSFPSSAIDNNSIPKTVRAYKEAFSRNIIQKATAKKASNIYESPMEVNVDDESYCNCNQPYLNGELMFKCEGFCSNWYHPECLKMKTEEIELQKNSTMRWYCPKCISKAKEVMMECYDNSIMRMRYATIG